MAINPNLLHAVTPVPELDAKRAAAHDAVIDTIDALCCDHAQEDVLAAMASVYITMMLTKRGLDRTFTHFLDLAERLPALNAAIGLAPASPKRRH